MSAVEFTLEQSQFLSSFFGPGNQLRWDAYVSGAMAASSRDLLSPLIDDFRKGNVPVILPRVRDSVPNSVQWYAMANHAREASALREQLTAFIGPTYSDFVGQVAELDVTDPVESVIAEKYSPHVFRLGIVKHEDRDKVRNKIFLMRSLRDRFPVRTTQLSRPVGRLLRDLEMALAVRNESSAWQCLDDLRIRGRLSSHNLAFLKVRILSNFVRWNEILALPEKNSLITIRRPAQVTHALVQAIYNVEMSAFEQTNDVIGCIQRFRQLEPNFGTLFRSRGESRDPTVLKAFLIRAVAATSIHPEAVRSIADHYPIGNSGRVWVDALASYASSQLTEADSSAALATTAIDRAREACESGDFDSAFEQLLKCESSAVVVRQLLACSREIDSLDAARRSLEYIEQCPPDVRDAALSMRVFRQMWDDLTQQASAVGLRTVVDDIPTNWMTWIERLNTGGVWSAAAEIGRRGALEWSIDDFRGQPERIFTFASLLISARPTDAEAMLRNVLPDLLTHFLPDGKAIKEFKPIYLNLAYILALDDSINADDLSGLAILTESFLECAPSVGTQGGTNEFREIVETLEAAWNQVASPRHIDWALHSLDLLIGFNVSANSPINAFFNLIVDAFREWSRRIRQDQWDLFGQLAADLGQEDSLTGLRQEEATANTNCSSLREYLSGKSIAIYSLTERIGHRVAEVFTDSFTNVRVHLLHDHASTDRLEQLAKSVDVFIVNTWDAKHAATNAIQAIRPKDAVTLFPRSKSAGSMIRVLYDFVANANSTTKHVSAGTPSPAVRPSPNK